MAKVVMYCTAVCPYCVAAERLLKSRGVTVYNQAGGILAWERANLPVTTK